jgi:general secretion pathway protein G
MRIKRRGSQGFTLVEILIVVIILGILAAIVIPQFTNASTSARQSNLTTQLQSLRQQIALYQLQHNNTYPLLISGSGWPLLTEYTDINGNVSATADSTHIYGPYLESIPVNPLTAAATASNVAADASSSPGWVYNETTGQICATGTVSTTYFNETTGGDSSTRPW